ncbi:hypothetical protein [Aquibacillus rhizosphaerae]|uniref:Uncharacterized protein n=1 Tax=Aquibacillus rhizosphaerae TaxID=3051431 RepID=A0ABT7L3X2_9BACI|nr:hypothetical protein [Aquibacillus sp. LR5S19]MDL4840566.1 hypothetical protein [Aquibacillus sp. LR5S19]
MMSERCNVISLSNYKRERNGLDKPIFDEPVTITIGEPDNPFSQGKYVVVCNLVHDDRQFLALERSDKTEELYLLVEAIVENQSLVEITPVAEGDYTVVEPIFKKIFNH